MRIHPPKLIIPDTDPFSVDLLRNRKKFGDTLTALFRKMDKDENLVVLVDAPWGGGKSTFIDMWEKALKNPQPHGDTTAKPVNLIRFDAFAADHHEDPFVAFSGEVVEFIRQKNSESLAGAAQEFGTKAARFGARFFKPLIKGAIKVSTAGTIDCDAIQDAMSESTDIVAEAIQKRIEQYGEDHKGLKEFKAALAQVAAQVRIEQDFPLVIVVDELDRCRPDFALKLLERIKHLFDVPGVAFLLFAHKAQLEELIRHAYGREVDANAYLHKFIHITTRLPDDGHLYQLSDCAKYCLSLAPHYGWGTCPQQHRDKLMNAVELTDLTLRETEKLLGLLSLCDAPLGQTFHDHHQEMLLYVLAAIKIKHHDLYNQAKQGLDTHEKLLSRLRLEKPGGKWEGVGLDNELMRFWVINVFAAPAVREAKKPKSLHGSFFGSADTRHIIARHVRILDVFEIA